MTLTLTLPFSKETRGAVLYQVEGERTGLPFSNLYVRKDSLRRPGQKGWPVEIKVTVEVPE